MHPSSEPHRVFIAYSSDDREYVAQLDEILREVGLDPIWDRHLQAGYGFTDRIQLFIKHAHVFLPLFTPRSVSRNWVHEEVGFAHALSIPVLPVCIGVKPPPGMIEKIQAIVLEEHSGEAPDRLPEEAGHVRWLERVEACVREAERKPTALYEVAPDNVSRAEKMAEYAWAVSGIGRSGCVRQKGALSSFHLPDATFRDPAWKERWGNQAERVLDEGYCKALRKERQALEGHATAGGCKLILDFAIRFVDYGPLAFPARLRVLRAFLRQASDVIVGIDRTRVRPNESIRSESTTIVGDWFVAQSVSGVSGRGYLNTVFTRHAPVTRISINEFDEELELILRDQPGGADNSREYALWTIDQLLEEHGTERRGKLVLFDYAPADPTDHGWHLGETEPASLNYERIDRGPLAPALAVRARDRYQLTYPIEDPGFRVEHVKIVFRPHRESALYVRVDMKKDEEERSRDGWLRLAEGERPPRHLGFDEWLMLSELDTVQIGSGWRVVRVDIGRAFASTFATQGFRLQRLSGLRMRGDVDLSYVELTEGDRSSAQQNSNDIASSSP